MKRTILMLAGAVLLTASLTRGEERSCTVPASKGETKDQLVAKARVSEEAARATALKAASERGKASVKESELEVEDGCLVYSFDIQVEGEKGVQEILVDAGNGQVLKSEHETESQEAKEKQEKH
jgi:uncharacterized membrane protein YkoI